MIDKQDQIQIELFRANNQELKETGGPIKAAKVTFEIYKPAYPGKGCRIMSNKWLLSISYLYVLAILRGYELPIYSKRG